MMTKNAPFSDWLAHHAALVEARLDALLSPPRHSPALAAAMRDSALDGGKRLRPAALFAVAERDGALADAALDAACALELIHCYSLVHDDMPCMDNDDMRRGKPSCHKAHGEGMALLAGDCLHSLAFETLAASGLPGDAVRLLAHAAGAGGMGGGQALDIRGGAGNETELETMHRLKTGALFDCALRLGLLCRADGDSAALRRAVARFSGEFGLLFQIANDLSDQRQDADAGKATYATLLGCAQASARAAAAKTKALAAAEELFPRLADITHAVYPS